MQMVDTPGMLQGSSRDVQGSSRGALGGMDREGGRGEGGGGHLASPLRPIVTACVPVPITGGVLVAQCCSAVQMPAEARPPG